MDLWIGRDLDTFTHAAEDFLRAGIERQILATVHQAVLTGRYPDALLATMVAPDGSTIAAAIRTPPHNLLVTGEIADPLAFIERWRDDDPDLSGVTGEPRLARPIAAAWAAATGGQTQLHMSEALHVLERVTPPEPTQPPTQGHLRRADWRESAQLRGWGRVFGIEARLGDPELAVTAIEAQLERGSLHVWEAEGRPATMIGHTPSIGGVVRIGPVYTPAELRGRGYGTAATAALSQWLLDDGADRCILYTDLANPVSNHVYAKVGYVRAGDWEEHTFTPPAPTGP